MPAAKFETLVDLFEQSTARYPQRELFGTKVGGQWIWTTYGQVKKLVDDFRGGLSSLGVQAGDRVGIIANNRVEWAVAAYATYGLGAAFVPMYESQHEADWEFILADSGAKVVIAASAEIAEKIKGFPSKIATLSHIVELAAPETNDLSYKALLKRGAREPAPLANVTASDTACFIYTSGTTGNPKGVELTHGNIGSNVLAVDDLVPFVDGDRTLSILPWAHSFGHTCELHGLIWKGAASGIAESAAKVVENLAEVSPTVLFAVPHVFNRIYSGVSAQMAAQPKAIQFLFSSAMASCAKKRKGQRLSTLETLGLALADRLIFTKVRARFGGKLKYAVSGGAALAREVAEFIDSLGISVYEGYGLTETSPIVASNYPGHRKIGSVGKPIPGVRVTIDTAVTGDPDQGEIVVHGPNVMKGYHGHPDETRAVLTQDGGFRTGDMGRLDKDGYLFITGRIKEQYKLENGKYVVPSPLEEYLKLSPFIANVMVHGANKPYNVALIVPELVALKAWARSHGVSAGSDAELLRDERTRRLFREEIDKHSGEFKGYERVKRFALVAEDFTQQNDMLTPSLKLKRRNVLKQWSGQIDGLYSQATDNAA